MSQDPAEFEKQILSSDKRFEVYVPKPAAQLNMGKPAGKNQAGGPYGFDGVTLSAQDNVFVESGADMVIQSGGGANVLVNNELGLYVGGDAQFTSGGDLRVSAAQRVLVISGSNNDPSTRSNHGDLRLQAYNNLAQHYRINSLEVGLFEFFHGRRDRPKKTTPTLLERMSNKHLQKDTAGKWVRTSSSGTTKNYHGKRKTFNSSKPVDHGEIAQAKKLKGGFAGLTLATLDELYPAERSVSDKGELFFPIDLPHAPKSRKKAEKGVNKWKRSRFGGLKHIYFEKIPSLGDKADPRRLIEPLFANDPFEPGLGVASTIFGNPEVEEVEYGFSRYFSRFDPYKLEKPKAFAGWAARAIVTMENGIIRLRRYLDCIVHLTGFPGAIANLLAPALASVTANPVFGVLAATYQATVTVTGQIDQYKGKYGSADGPDNPFAEPGAAFANGPWSGPADDRKASVKSQSGPWDLSGSKDPVEDRGHERGWGRGRRDPHDGAARRAPRDPHLHRRASRGGEGRGRQRGKASARRLPDRGRRAHDAAHLQSVQRCRRQRHRAGDRDGGRQPRGRVGDAHSGSPPDRRLLQGRDGGRHGGPERRAGPRAGLADPKPSPAPSRHAGRAGPRAGDPRRRAERRAVVHRSPADLRSDVRAPDRDDHHPLQGCQLADPAQLRGQRGRGRGLLLDPRRG